MHTQHRQLAALAVVLALVLVVPASPGNGRTFTSHLTGAQEVPPVDTQAQGQLKLKLSKDGTTLGFKLIVANIDDVVAAHLHLGVVGMNGPIVVGLYSGAPDGPFSGVLAKGTITAADLTGPYAGLPLSTLIEALEDGDIYVNVHTSANPGGEIRGQVRQARRGGGTDDPKP